MHVSHEVQPRAERCDAPVALQRQMVQAELPLHRLSDAMQEGLVGMEDDDVVHVAVVVLQTKALLAPVVEVGQHERGENLAGVQPYRKPAIPGRSEDEFVQDVQCAPALHLALHQLEQLLSGDAVEIAPDIALEVVQALPVGRCVDVLADAHGASVRAFVGLCGIRLLDARAQKDRRDDLEHRMLDDAVGIGPGIAEVAELAPLVYVAGAELGIAERPGAQDVLYGLHVLLGVLLHRDDLRVAGMVPAGVLNRQKDVLACADGIIQLHSVDSAYSLQKYLSVAFLKKVGMRFSCLLVRRLLPSPLAESTKAAYARCRLGCPTVIFQQELRLHSLPPPKMGWSVNDSG